MHQVETIPNITRGLIVRLHITSNLRSASCTRWTPFQTLHGALLSDYTSHLILGLSRAPPGFKTMNLHLKTSVVSHLYGNFWKWLHNCFFVTICKSSYFFIIIVFGNYSPNDTGDNPEIYLNLLVILIKLGQRFTQFTFKAQKFLSSYLSVSCNLTL